MFVSIQTGHENIDVSYINLSVGHPLCTLDTESPIEKWDGAQANHPPSPMDDDPATLWL